MAGRVAAVSRVYAEPWCRAGWDALEGAAELPEVTEQHMKGNTSQHQVGCWASICDGSEAAAQAARPYAKAGALGWLGLEVQGQEPISSGASWHCLRVVLDQSDL